MPNFTLDDTDSTLSYSADGWAVQLPTDPDLDRFFDKTYHTAQADGASMSFTFQGTGFALYGSKGPGHGKFQVQFDGTVVNLDASAPASLFQQELFSHTFSTTNSSTHLVKLTAVLSGDGLQGRWLDVDYITFSSGPASTAASTIGTVTSLPPWLSSASSQTSSATTSSKSSLYTPTSSSSSSKVPTILAALFGGLIGLALVLLVLYCLLRRVYDRGRARERVFRYGQSSANPSVSLAGTYAHSAAGSGKSAGAGALFSPTSAGGPGAGFGAGFGGGAGAGGAIDLVPLRREEQAAGRDGSLSSNLVEMRTASTDVLHGGREGAATPAGVGSSASRPLLSTSPIAWTRQKHKGDADSLRTDFLQV